MVVRSRRRCRIVRATLASTGCVSAPRRVRLPPQTFRATTAGRMACSARQLNAECLVMRGPGRRDSALQVTSYTSYTTFRRTPCWASIYDRPIWTAYAIDCTTPYRATMCSQGAAMHSSAGVTRLAPFDVPYRSRASLLRKLRDSDLDDASFCPRQHQLVAGSRHSWIAGRCIGLLRNAYGW